MCCNSFLISLFFPSFKVIESHEFTPVFFPIVILFLEKKQAKSTVKIFNTSIVKYDFTLNQNLENRD